LEVGDFLSSLERILQIIRLHRLLRLEPSNQGTRWLVPVAEVGE
jgi:hypothetical protein